MHAVSDAVASDRNRMIMSTCGTSCCEYFIAQKYDLIALRWMLSIERHSGRSVTSEGSWLSVADGLIVAVHLDVVWMRGQPLFCAGSRPVLASVQLPLRGAGNAAPLPSRSA
jgi:hypothetical protein